MRCNVIVLNVTGLTFKSLGLTVNGDHVDLKIPTFEFMLDSLKPFCGSYFHSLIHSIANLFLASVVSTASKLMVVNTMLSSVLDNKNQVAKH